MQERNTFVLEYLDDEDRIADFINGVYYHGQNIISSSDIQELDGGVRRIWNHWGKRNAQFTLRDCIRKVVKGTQYVIVGIEHQTAIDYTMPVRVLGYDSGTYERQIRKLKKSHRKKKDLRGNEFTSGISSKDRLAPVLTTVLYFGEDVWDGPRDLHGMLDLDGSLAYLKAWVPNYKINILEVQRYPYWKNFQTDLRQVFGYLYHLKDRESLSNYLNENKEEYEDLLEDAYDVLSAVTGTEKLQELKKNYQNEYGGVDMWKAMRDIIDSGVQEGIQQGIQQGVDQGKEMLEKLIQWLLDQSRSDEIERAVRDKVYQDKLFEEAGIVNKAFYNVPYKVDTASERDCLKC